MMSVILLGVFMLNVIAPTREALNIIIQSFKNIKYIYRKSVKYISKFFIIIKKYDNKIASV